MDSDKAIGLLEDCELGLKKLLADASIAGDYDAARRLMSLAEAMKGLKAEAGANGTAVPSLIPTPSSLRRGRVRPGEEYPKFFRKGDELVKVGWSKKERKEYHHRAPRSAIDALAAVVKSLGTRGKVFTSDDILPLKDASAGSDFPPYQAYVALAWLKQLNLVQQHGRRGGYTLVAGAPLDSTIGLSWTQLKDWLG